LRRLTADDADASRRIADVLLRVTADDYDLPGDDGRGFLLSQALSS
jgi:hypothetical protein